MNNQWMETWTDKVVPSFLILITIFSQRFLSIVHHQPTCRTSLTAVDYGSISPPVASDETIRSINRPNTKRGTNSLAVFVYDHGDFIDRSAVPDIRCRTSSSSSLRRLSWTWLRHGVPPSLYWPRFPLTATKMGHFPSLAGIWPGQLEPRSHIIVTSPP